MRFLLSTLILLARFLSDAQTIQQDENNIRISIQLGDAAKLSKEYEKAVSHYELGATISKKYKSAFVDELITCNSNLAFSEYMLGNYENASQTYRTNLTIIESRFGRNSTVFVFDLYLLAGCEKDLQHYDIAIKIYEEAKGIFKTKFGISDANYVNCFLRQAQCYSYYTDKKNKINASENFEFYLKFQKSRNQSIEFYKPFLFSYGLNLMELNYIFSIEQNKDSASIYLNKAEDVFIEIYNFESKSKGPNIESIKPALSQLALIDIKKEKYSQAIAKYNELIKIENESNSDVTYDKIYYLSEILNVYLKANNLKKASKIERKINKDIIYLKNGNPQKNILILKNIALYYSKVEKNYQEIGIRKEILNLQKEVYENNCNEHSALEHKLIGQAFNKIALGDSVFYHFQKSKELYACTFGEQSREFIETLLEQTLYYSFYQTKVEDEQRLLKLFQELDFLEKQGLLTLEDINDIISYKQEYYQKKGDIAQLLSLERQQHKWNTSKNDQTNLLLLILEAEDLRYSGQQDRAYELTKRIFSEYPNMDSALLRKLLRCAVNLPMMVDNDIEKSYQLAKWSVDLHNDKKLWDENSNNLKHYLSQVSFLSTILIAMKKIDEAIELLEQNLALGQKYLKSNDNSVYSIYYKIGVCLFLKNNNTEAIKSIKKAQSYDVDLNNTSDPLYISSLKQLAYCYVSENQFLNSDTLMVSYLEHEINAVKKVVLQLSEQDMEYVKINAINAISAFTNYAVMRYQENPELLTLALNQWLYFNDLQKNQKDFLHDQSLDSEIYREYSKLENQISKALQLPKSVRERELLNIEDLIIEKRKIETEIKGKANQNIPEPNLELIQNNLQTKQNYVIVIPYINIPLIGIKGSDLSPKIGKQFYLALCINKEKGIHDYQIIQNTEDLENELFKEYEIYIENKTYQQTSYAVIYENYFKPIERFFCEKKTFFCASGIYNELNLEAIYHPEKKDLLINLYDFQYVTPNKYDFNEKKPLNLTKVSLFGDIDFGDGVSKAKKQNEIFKEYGVIGIQPGISESNNINIDKLELGLPAELNGLKVNDKIIEIDGEEVNLKNNELSYYLNKIRGPALTQVNLKVLRPENNSTISFSITRAQTVIATPKIEFTNLPGTKDEINSIAEILKRKNISTQVYTKQEANELNLKKIENVDILHIATHSFFVEPKNIANSTFVGILENEFSVSPFLFNGLVLSDVNNFFYPEMTLEKENGFVNGLEITLLNLKETELVIISGCESGKAIYGIGESKFGFKEALFRAGVKNVILSDYNIDDEATAQFYSIFYTILTDKEMSIQETLKATKIEMQKKYKHPYYWAAFQLYTN
jgi:hypothetical protein